jgi:autotransporter-associated beta strand protein
MAVLTCLAALPVRGAVLEFRFNDTGTTSVSTGTDPTVVSLVTLVSPGTSNALQFTDLHSPAGMGVAGDVFGNALYGTDRAFDNRAATGMGSNQQANTPWAQRNPPDATGNYWGGAAMSDNNGDLVPERCDSIQNFQAWTVSGWYKTSEVALGYAGAQIFSTLDNKSGNGTSGGFAVRTGGGVNTMRVTLNGTNQPEPNLWTDIQKWVFFAVTYDGTQTTNNLTYYRGYRNVDEAGTQPVQVTQVAIGSAPSGTMRPDQATTGFGIGNYCNIVDPIRLNRPFQGLLDNIRVDGSTVDATGALGPAALEAIRAGDVAVPAFVWRGNRDTGPIDWDLPANWDPRLVPDDGAIVSFGAPSTTGTVNLGGTGRWVSQIDFSNDNSLAGTTIVGDAGTVLTLGGYRVSSAAGTVNNIDVPVVLAAKIKFTGDGSLNLNAGIARGSGGITKGGGGTLTLGGTCTFAGPISVEGGVLVLRGTNAFQGTTTIANGLLDAAEGTGLPTDSGLCLGSAVISGVATPGVLQTNGAFRRAIASNGAPAAGNVVWQSGGGFAARNGDLVVNLGRDSTPTDDVSPLPLTWGEPGFVKSDAPLIFGTASSNGTVVWKNPIQLTSDSQQLSTREISVRRGAGTAPEVDVQGVISDAAGGTGILDKTGDGTLKLSAANTYQGGTLVEAGTLMAANASGSATGAGQVVLYPSAVLASGAVGAIAGQVIASTGATVAPGGLGAFGALTLNSGLSLGDAAVLDFDVTDALQDALTLHAALTLFPNSRPSIALHAGGALSGNYVLATYPLSAVGLSNFNVTGLPAGYVLDIGQKQIKLLSSTTGSGEWRTTASGDWSVRSNWTTVSSPNAVDANALLGALVTDDTTVRVDAGVTLGTLELDSAHHYRVDGPGTLTMQAARGSAAITDAAGSHAISAPLVLASDTDVLVSVEGDTLTLDGGILHSPGALTKLGPGTLVLSGGNSYTGGTTVAAGALYVATPGALPSGMDLLIAVGGRVVLAEGLNAAAAGRRAASLAAVPEPCTALLLGVWAGGSAIWLLTRRLGRTA